MKTLRFTGLSSIISRMGGGIVLVLGGLIVLAFLTGGASRHDVWSLTVLRPAAILCLGYGLWTIRREDVRAYRWLFGVALAALLLALIQLLPLPPALWARLPGRELVVDIDRLAGLNEVWRPISLVPAATWNSFYAMLVPMAALVLGAQLRVEQHRMLLPLLIGLGLLSAVLALLQLIGPPEGPLYTYRLTDHGAAVGLFANRNHQAILLTAIFPLLAVFAALGSRSGGRERRRVFAIGVGAFLLPLLLVTGARIGLVTAAVGLASVLILYRPAGRSQGAAPSSGRRRERVSGPRAARSHRGLIAAGLTVATCVGISLLTILLGRAEAFQRLMQVDATNEYRLRAWKVVGQLIADYLPIGSGFGSFVEVYQVAEPRSLLDQTYFNHAHNDWLEVLLTGGLPALALLVVAVGLVVVRMVQLWRIRGGQVQPDELLARLGLVLIVLFGIASFADYPLRTPVLSVFFTMAALWAGLPLRRRFPS